MNYLLIKNLHIVLATASISGFVLRWYWMKSGSKLAQHKMARILPHIIDSLFLAMGIWLAFMLQQFPFSDHWLTAKVLGLLAYIILGSLALKRARSPAGQNIAFGTALLVFAWIVTVAISKNPWSMLSLLGR